MSEHETMQRVGFAGAGAMGSAMIANLLLGGNKVRVWNRTKTSPHYVRALEAGALPAETPEELAERCTVIFYCLNDAASVNTLAAEMTPSLREGTLLIDCTTTGPKAAVFLAESMTSRGVLFSDAPVTGGVRGAREATLTVMAGGSAEAFAAAEPYLRCIGSKIRYCGPAGSGQTVKLINQFLCAMNLAAACEAMKAAAAHGIDLGLAADVYGSGMGTSRQLTEVLPSALSEDFTPGFRVKHMLKDLRLTGEAFPALAASPGFADVIARFKNLAEKEEAAEAGTQILYKTY